MSDKPRYPYADAEKTGIEWASQPPNWDTSILNSRTTRRHSKKTRLKLSRMRMGSLNPFFGKHHKPEIRAAMIERLAKYRKNPTTKKYQIAPRNIQISSQWLAGYIAGLIDGEGSISFKAGQPTVYVYNTCVALMRFLKASVGGSVVRRKRSNPNWKPNYFWSLGGARNVAYLLDTVMPYLIIKRERGWEMLSKLNQKYGSKLWENEQA